MESIAIILSIVGLTSVFAYLATQFKTGSEGGTKWGSVMKALFNTVAFTLALLLPFAGMQIAANNSWSSLETLMQVSLIPTVMTYLIYMFYLIMVYAEDAFNFIKSDPIDRRR